MHFCKFCSLYRFTTGWPALNNHTNLTYLLGAFLGSKNC